MNTNFQVRKVTGYDPGYPRARRRPGRLEARPLKFLFLVVGFLFFFTGFGCGEDETKTTGVQVIDDDTLLSDVDAAQPDYDDMQGVTDPDIVLDDAAGPDLDEGFNELGGAPLVDEDIEAPDYDDQTAGEPIPDADGLLPDGDSIVCPVDADDILAGDPIPDAPLVDAEVPDYDDQLTGDSAPAVKFKK